MYGFGGDWLWHGFLGLVFMIVFWVAVVYLTVHLIQNGSNWNRRDGEGKALEILKERYAKGEISKEEFEEMKKNIEK